LFFVGNALFVAGMMFITLKRKTSKTPTGRAAGVFAR
jgi:hypothetical protein